MPGLPVRHQPPEFTQTHVHWVGDAIQPSHPFIIPFSSCLQSVTPSEFFPISQLFTSGGQSIGSSILASVLPMNILDWFPFGLTGLISLQSKRLSGVFSSTTVQRHQFFGEWPLFLGFALLGSRQKTQVFIKAHLTLWDFRFSLQQRWLRKRPVIPSASQPAAALGTGQGCCLRQGSCLRVSTSEFLHPRHFSGLILAVTLPSTAVICWVCRLSMTWKESVWRFWGLPSSQALLSGIYPPIFCCSSSPAFVSSAQWDCHLWCGLPPCVTSKTWKVTTGEKPGANVLTSHAFPFANLDTPHIPGCISGPPLHSKCCFLKCFVWDFPSVSVAKTALPMQGAGFDLWSGK